MKIEDNTLKLFLSNGVTLTVSDKEKVYTMKDEELTLKGLYDLIENAINEKRNLSFKAELNHEYKVDEKLENQEVTHYYNIPYEKISWFMIEEV